MPLETFGRIEDLNPANPPGTDNLSQADDHLRGIKESVLGSFPSLGPNQVTVSADTINDVLTKTMLLALYPVGSVFIGADPTAILTGSTWAPLAEGTFLMATVANADPSGGSNFKQLQVDDLPSHTHTIADHNHFMFSPNGTGGNTPIVDYVARQSATGSNNDYGIRGASPSVTPGAPTDGTTSDTSLTVDPTGAGDPIDFRPLYKGVQAWVRQT